MANSKRKVLSQDQIHLIVKA
ncbi:MAG: hypothetical protein JWO80_1903, partial [Bryobacterales bacterium]|nr:hypothetical protein [Bryobacterales bacterium]